MSPSLSVIKGAQAYTYRADKDEIKNLSFEASSFIPKISPEKRILKQRIDQVLGTHGKENWDGEGASPILLETADTAKSIVDCFPSMPLTHLPDVVPTPHGEIDFDWLISKDMMLTISAGSKGEIAYAGIFEISKTEQWNYKLPGDVSAWFAALEKISTND